MAKSLSRFITTLIAAVLSIGVTLTPVASAQTMDVVQFLHEKNALVHVADKSVPVPAEVAGFTDEELTAEYGTQPLIGIIMVGPPLRPTSRKRSMGRTMS